MDATVLIVDDSPEMIDILRDILPAKMKKQVALNGTNALKLLHLSDDLPDLILLDIVMPGIDGFQVCRMIKSVNKFRKIPIIFISSLDESFDKVKAFEVGAVDYVTKPFNREEVLARITTHLDLHKSKNMIEELYSETIQGTIGAMNNMLALTNPEVSNFSNSMKLYSERIMRKLKVYDIWDLKLACVLSGLGMLSENMKKEEMSCVYNKESINEDVALTIKKAYESLALSNDIIKQIPRFEAVTKIIESAMQPLGLYYRNIPLEKMRPEVLKGQVLRILTSYLYQFENEKNYVRILREMRESDKEYYYSEILTALAEVQSDLINSEITTVSIDEVEPQMILMENMHCPQGRLILKSGYELSEQTILLIKNFGLSNDVKVEVMRNW